MQDIMISMGKIITISTLHSNRNVQGSKWILVTLKFNFSKDSNN